MSSIREDSPKLFTTNGSAETMDLSFQKESSINSSVDSTAAGHQRVHNREDLGTELAEDDVADNAASKDGDCIENHESSFCASLVMEQQLRRQRDITARASSLYGTCGSTPSSTFTPTAVPATSADSSPSSPRTSTSRAPSAVVSTSLFNSSLFRQPRTLRDLLAWRQELMEARMRELAEQQQQQRRGSDNFCWGVGGGYPGNEGCPLPTNATQLAIEIPASPCRSLSSRPTSLQGFLSAQSSVMPTRRSTGAGGHPYDVVEARQAPVSTESPLYSPFHRAHPSPKSLGRRSTSCFSPVTPSSGPLSPALPRGRALRRRDGQGESSQWQECPAGRLPHDDCMELSVAGTFLRLLMFLLMLAIVFDPTLLTGGGRGAFFLY
ncbi:hypothetical protein ABL78_3419 [Leptomonas seymouri]|uniref:Uncharacterized protein n=1 Tax=Leptomonas seymouri TaxID=5684 RepID=A0A0N1PDU0_LEPSE|nr:hypothetical protein ABL78_3419 [Leptomonas seymouri]|eukprot:KPI87508.1 hypothetical protein ABL78_3419 [Leptomonas seymouri]